MMSTNKLVHSINTWYQNIHKLYFKYNYKSLHGIENINFCKLRHFVCVTKQKCQKY